MTARLTSRHHAKAQGRNRAARSASRRRRIGAAVGALLALALTAIAAPAASAAPWSCDGSVYLSQFDGTNPAAGTMLRRADRQPDGSYQLNTLGTMPDHLNALGFRPQDGFMYGWNNTTSEVVRIERDPFTDVPTFDDIGNPPGSGITTTVIGTVLDDGTYFVWWGTSGAIFDVSGPTAQLVRTVTGDPGPQGDMAVSPIDGSLYSVDLDANGTTWGVYRFALIGGTITRGARLGDATSAGGHWFQPDGTFTQYNNGPPGPNGNGIYASDPDTGALSFLGPGPQFSNADATACANGVSLVKDAEPRTVTAGSEVTYTHTITSRALFDGNVDFSDQLPPGLTFVPGSVTVSPQIGTPNAYGDTGTLSLSGTISPQQTVTIAARVRVSPDHACGADVQNQSRSTLTVPGYLPVTADSDDPDTPTEPDDATTVRVVCAADLAIEKRAATSPLVPGEQATFTLVATNNGASTARNVRVSDQLPPELAFESASDGCSEAGGTVTCTVGSLAPGASQTFTVSGQVASSLDTCLENTATVSSDTPDPIVENNTATICEPINGRSNLSIRKTSSRTEVGAGGQVMFTLVVRNQGPSDNPGVKISDPLAAGLTLVSAEPSQGRCSTDANALECDMGRLKVGGSVQVLVTAQLSGSECVTNTARVQGALVDPTPQNNEAAARVCPTPDPDPRFDLAVSKSANDRSALIGQTVRYRVSVRNNGPDAAPGVELTDTLNAPTRVVSVRASQGSCGKRIPLRCELGAIAAGERVTITIRAKHRDAGCRQRNAASATGDGTDADPANNMGTVQVCVRKVPLRISKVASRSTVAAGDVLGYRIRVRNPSVGEARGVRVCDRLPSGLSYVSSKPRGKRAGRTTCWTIKRLGAKQSRTFRVTVRAARGAIGRKVNTATLRSPDARGGTLRARDRVRIIGRPTPVTG